MSYPTMRPATILGGAPQPEDPRRAYMRFMEERDKLKARTLELALEFAAEDEAFRRKLAKGIRELGKGKRGDNARAALLRAMAVRTDFELLGEYPRSWLGEHRAKHGTPQGAEPWIPTKQELATKVAELQGAPSPDAARKRLQRAKCLR